MLSHHYYRVLLRKWKKKLFIYKLFGFSLFKRYISTGYHILIGQKRSIWCHSPHGFQLARHQHSVLTMYMNTVHEYMRYDYLGATIDFQIFICRKVKKLKETEKVYTCKTKCYLLSKRIISEYLRAKLVVLTVQIHKK